MQKPELVKQDGMSHIPGHFVERDQFYLYAVIGVVGGSGVHPRQKRGAFKSHSPN